MVLLAALALSVSSYANKMDNYIQEAIYVFEMKGDVSEATSLLEKVVAQGDEEDKENAYFYLGKIQELSGNNQSSNFYYKQSLSRTSDVEKSYWLAERNASTSNQVESFLQSPISLKNRVQKFIGTNPTFCIYLDGTLGKIEDQKVSNIPLELPEGNQILHVTPRGVWYQVNGIDSLYFAAFHTAKQQYSYDVPRAQDFSFQENHALIQSGRRLTIISKKGTQINIADKYEGCTVEGFFKPTNEYMLNCPDNALHFIAFESGSEERTIAQFDVIKKTLVHKNQLYLVSNGFLYNYIPKRSSTPLWKYPVNNVESLFAFGSYIAILEASGKVSLLGQDNGIVRTAVLTDATAMYPLAHGTIGLFNNEGSITTIDTLLQPLWNFSFTKPIESQPIQVDGTTYLYFGDKKLQPILSKYYGKRILQSEVYAHRAAELCEKEQWDSLAIVLDTLFKLEPGNAEGWFFKALSLENRKGTEKERQKAWSEAVRLAASNPRITNLIFKRYGKAIGAKSISLLPISPKTRYPQFFGNKKDLYTLDPAADRLLNINTENGELRWSRFVGQMENSPAVANDEKNLVVASGYRASFFDLNKETNPTRMQLPGKAFDVKVYENATYISTWNGFLLKVMKSENKLAWSRKIYSVPFFMLKDHGVLYTCNLEGEFNVLDDAAGQVTDGYTRKIQGPISHMTKVDSNIVVATTNNKLFLFNPDQVDRSMIQILQESSIASLQSVHYEGSSFILMGLADQSVLLYSKQGAPLWKYKGHHSIFINPFVKDGEAWIDQGSEIVSLSIKDGSILRKFSTPGGAGTPFVQNRTLYSASPKRILYSFSL